LNSLHYKTKALLVGIEDGESVTAFSIISLKSILNF